MAEQNRKRHLELEDRNKTLIGSIALGVLAVLLATLVIVSRVGPGYHRYTAEFLQAAALQPKNPVTVAGIPVGTVTGLKLSGDHVTVSMRVRNDIRLGKDSRAVIMVTTILGSRYLALHPGGGGPLPDNTIDLNHTEVPYDLQQALQDVTVTYGEVDTDNLAASMEALGQQIKALPPMVPKAMDNLRTLSTVMADRREQFGSMLRTLDLVTSTLRRQQSSIGSMVNQGQQLLSEFVLRRAAFHAMLQSLTNLVGSLGDVVIKDRPQLEALLNDMRTLTGMLSQHDDMVRNILQSGPPAVRGLANVAGTGNAVDLFFDNGIAVDSWMCAISGRAKQFGMVQYFKDCK
jgi:virulence factor Mce-like protein